MGDHERWIDLALFDAFEKLRLVVLDRRLRHAERKAAVDRRTHGNVVEQAAVHADD
jgi:hypothetical protein